MMTANDPVLHTVALKAVYM